MTGPHTLSVRALAILAFGLIASACSNSAPASGSGPAATISPTTIRLVPPTTIDPSVIRALADPTASTRTPKPTSTTADTCGPSDEHIKRMKAWRDRAVASGDPDAWMAEQAYQDALDEVAACADRYADEYGGGMTDGPDGSDYGYDGSDQDAPEPDDPGYP